GDTTNVDVLYGKTDTSGYYACKQDYNSNYPVLYNKFEELDYVRQSSYVYPHTTTANKSGLVNEYVYYNNNKVDTKFMIVPTATAFINMESGASDASKNYVITRHMNFGYMGFNSENNRGSIKYTLVSGGSIISGLNFVNIDGQNHSIMNLQLGKCDKDGKPLEKGKNLIGVLDSNAKLYDLRFQNLTLYDSTGIIGENYGTITGVIIAGNINYATYTEDGFFGTLVGKNYGYVGTTKEIEDGAKTITATKAKSLYGCKINADSINGANSTAATYYFGGLVGQNVGDEDTSIVGIIKNITINLNNVKINEKLTSGGGYIVQNLYFGGALGLLAGGKVSNCVLETAKVLVVAGNEVVVGGIIAVGQEGKVYNCETKTNCTIQAGSEDDEMQDDVLITPGTQTSYIGGIVGIGPKDTSTLTIYSLSIYDCYNGADIYAKAVWNFSGETRQIEHANTIIEEDDEGNIIRKGTVVYIVKKGTSDANAGGIISNYLTASKVANEGGDIGDNVIATKLRNTGKVVGGFSAYKPVGVFCTKNNMGALEFVGYAVSGTTGAVAGLAGLVAAIEMGFASTPPGMIITAASALFMGIKMIYDTIKEVLTARLIYTPFLGNSNTYNKDKIYLDDNIMDSIHEEKILDKSGFMYHWETNYINVFGIQYKELESINKPKLFNSEVSLWYNGVYKYKHDNKEKEIDDYYIQYGGGESNDNHKYTQLEDICFDGICPTIEESDNIKNIMTSSEYKRITEVSQNKIDDSGNVLYTNYGYKLECDMGEEACKINSRLIFTEKDKIGYLKNDKYLSVFGWGDDDNLNVPWNTDGTLKIANPEILTPISGDGTDENPYRFILTDAGLWKNLTYTINTEKQDVDVFKYQSINTQIDIQTGSTIGIFVGTDTFNKFNGKLTFKANSRLCGYKVLLDGSVKDNTYGLGIIKESESAKVLNFMYVGRVEFAEKNIYNKQIVEANQTTNFKASFGLVIGKVNAGGSVEINGAVISNCSVEIPYKISSRLKDVSTLVGEANGNLNVKNVDVTIKRINVCGTIMDFENNSGDCTFGCVTGLIGSDSNVRIDETIVNVYNLQIISQINNAGGFVGKNLGSLTTNGVTANIGAFNLASYKNTHVGGILGYNNGSYAVEGSIFVGGIDELTTMLLSADIIKDNAVPYAGGVVGYDEHNPTYLSETGSIGIGNNDYALVDRGYAIDKILSGFNTYQIYSDLMLNNLGYDGENVIVKGQIVKCIPNESYASELIGNRNNTLDRAYVIVKNMVNESTSGATYIETPSETSLSLNSSSKYTNENWSAEQISLGKDHITYSISYNKYGRLVNDRHIYDINGNDFINSIPGYTGIDRIESISTFIVNGDGDNTIQLDAFKCDPGVDCNYLRIKAYIGSNQVGYTLDKTTGELTFTNNISKEETIKIELTTARQTLTISNIKTYYLYPEGVNAPQVVSEFTYQSYVEYGTNKAEGTFTETYLVKMTSLMDGDFLIEVKSVKYEGTKAFEGSKNPYNNEIIYSYKFSEIKEFAGNDTTIPVANMDTLLTSKEIMEMMVETGVISDKDSNNDDVCIVYTIMNNLKSNGMYIKFIKNNENGDITGIEFVEKLYWENIVDGIVFDKMVADKDGLDDSAASADLLGHFNSFKPQIRYSAEYERTFAQIPISILAQNSYTFARSDVEISSDITDELSYDVEVYEDGIMIVNKQGLGMAIGTNEAPYTDSETTKLTYTLQKPKANFYDGENEYENIFVYNDSYRGKNALIVSLRYEDIIKEKVYYYNGTNYALAAELSYNCPSFSDKKDIDGNYYTERDANFIPVGAMGISTRYYNIDAGSYTITNILDGITYRVIEKTVYIIDVIHNGEVYEQNGDIVIDLGQTTYKEYGVSYYYTTNKVAVNP
ncbi:MAG: hypothetical protein J6T74_03905, partial [Clostridia bacterium]|nr:hypothetical protein [Clostridia bacterium]